MDRWIETTDDRIIVNNKEYISVATVQDLVNRLVATKRFCSICLGATDVHNFLFGATLVVNSLVGGDEEEFKTVITEMVLRYGLSQKQRHIFRVLLNNGDMFDDYITPYKQLDGEQPK